MIWPCFWSQPQRVWGKKIDLNDVLDKRVKQTYSNIPKYSGGTIPNMHDDATRDWIQKNMPVSDIDDSLPSPDAWKDAQGGEPMAIQGDTITDVATQMQMEIRKTNGVLKKEIDNLVANYDALGQEEVCKSMITECLNNVATFLNAFSAAVDRVFAHEMNDIRVVQLQTAIQQHKIIIDNTLDKYASISDADTACDGNELLDIYRSLYEFNMRIDGLFTDIVKHGCPDYIADVLKSSGHVTDYKFVDKSDAKMLLVKIPEKLFKHSGYKSVEPMMERLEQMGVIVAAVPESLNLYEISEKDLNNIDLIKVSDFNRCSIPFFDDVPLQPKKK